MALLANACISSAHHRFPQRGVLLNTQQFTLHIILSCTGAPITLGSLPDSQHISSLALITNPPPLIADPSILAEANNMASMQSQTEQAPLRQQSQTLQLSSSTPSAMVSPGPGLPAISKKLYDAIRAGGYVDFAQFPAAKGRSIPPTSLEGQIVLVQASELVQTQRLVPDFATWVQCFAIYAAITITHSPEKAPGLMAYMLNIAKASIKFQWPSWVVYDQNFRIEAASTPTTDWSKVDPSIYSQCFSNMAKSAAGWCQICYSIDHCTENCMIKPRKRPSPTETPTASKKSPQAFSNNWPPICKNYNMFNGNCRGAKCRYRHCCSLCEKPGHYRANCFAQSSGSIPK